MKETDTKKLLLRLTISLMRAQWRARFFSDLCRLFFPISLLYPIMMLLDRLYPRMSPLLFAVPAAASIMFALLRGIFVPVSSVKTLYAADRRYDLKSSLLTAHSIIYRSADLNPLEKLHLRSTGEHIAKISPSAVFPLKAGIPPALIAAPVVLFIFSFLFGVLFHFGGTSASHYTEAGIEIETRARNAEVFTPAGESADLELLERIAALGKRLTENNVEKQKLSPITKELTETLRTRVGGLERDLVEHAVTPDREVEISESPGLSLRRRYPFSEAHSPEDGEIFTAPAAQETDDADERSNEELDRRIDAYKDTVESLEALDRLLAQDNYPDDSVPEASLKDNASEGQLRDGSVEGNSGTMAGSTSFEDRFTRHFEDPGEISDNTSEDSISVLRGKISGDSETSITTRTYTEPGAARLPHIDAPREYEYSVERAMYVENIPPEDRGTVLNYLYAIGMSGQDSSR